MSLTPEQMGFLSKEYEIVKGEYSALAVTSADMFKYAAATSGAIFAWLATDGVGTPAAPPVTIPLAWLAPLGLSLALGGMAGSLWRRMQMKAAYLSEVQEKVLGSPDFKIGLERYVAARCEMFGPGTMHTLSWLGLFAVNAVIGIAAMR